VGKENLMAEVYIKATNGRKVRLLLSATELLKLKKAIKKGNNVDIIAVAWWLF
jgi:hypothetical protein